ncbi:MAG: enoyl-CoA hydratase/isomerase family protein [Actinobacteria bacterium]|nr:enoyl-CoA hydratase/isomerase family protein [Actinomycetota bacterium]
MVGPSTVRTEWRDRVVVVTIDRPDRRNAVDLATLEALADAQAAARAGGARVLVLTGAPPAFCAGADLSGVDAGDFATALSRVLVGFTELGFATIAAIDGPALGAGTQLAVACDLRVATSSSVLGIPAAKLGLVVDRWTVDRLVRELGASVARAMLLSAQTYTAEHLLPMGAVHRFGGLAEALMWADEIAALAPLTISSHKLALKGLASPDGVDEVFEAARRAAWASADAEEGRTAFLEKRRPHFEGR